MAQRRFFSNHPVLMKFLIKTTLAAILISGAGAEATGRHGEAPNAIGEIQSVAVAPESRFGQGAERFCLNMERLKQQIAEQQGNTADEKPGFLRGGPGSVLFLVCAQGDDAEPKKEKAAEQGEKEGRIPDEATLRKTLTKTRKQLETVQQKIEGDHALWTRSGEQMKESRERIAELDASLARERLHFEKLRQSIARIEREHNDDHDREEALAAELSEHEKALHDFEGKQDAITKLERKATELRRQALELRKRAEELRRK